MLTYTSAALVSLLFSWGSVSVAKTADHTVKLQAANPSQALELSSARSPHSLSHRGSGRIYDRAIS
ncbi:MAG: hypothetical protein KME11_18925 [Timaviella obliquedivisa GSE-PSE-MK23-08B]|jgi:hypothetical protein|nr:hypothetical protein [Timaviella obliquedivisa GSE-PSE-MK23-08B]